MTEAETAAPTSNQPSSRTGVPAPATLALLSPLVMHLYMPTLSEIGEWLGVGIQRIELSVRFRLRAGRIVCAPISDRFG